MLRPALIALLAALLLVAGCGDDDNENDSSGAGVGALPVSSYSATRLTAAPDWVWAEADGRLARLDPQTGRTISKPRRSGYRVYDLAYGDSGLWAVAGDDQAVKFTRFDPRTGKPGSATALDLGPRFLQPRDEVTVAVGAGRVWAAALDRDRVVAFDPASGKQTAYTLGPLRGIVATDEAAWVLSRRSSDPLEHGNKLTRITPGGRPETVYEWSDEDAYRIAYGNNSLWIVYPGHVDRRDPATGRETAEIDLHDGADAGAGPVDAGGGVVAITSGNRLERIDPSTNKVLGTKPLTIPTDDASDVLTTGEVTLIARSSEPLVRVGPELIAH